MTQKIIFCFDGTGQDPGDTGDGERDSSISNILKLHAIFGGSLKESNKFQSCQGTKKQYSFYYPGIGTYSISWIKRKWQVFTGGGMNKILKKAREDLARNLEQNGKDCEIYVFGFSRGAATARLFASKIEKPIKFLGVFDTVVATTLDLNPYTYPRSSVLFENCTLSNRVEKVVHLVSLDERRLMFQPTLFNHDERVTEVWFSGVHSDVGGGYWFDGLSDITLEFMRSKAQNAGLEVLDIPHINYEWLNKEINNEESEFIYVDDIDINPLPNGKLHAQRRGHVMRKITLAPRLVCVNVNDKPSENVPIIHHTVLKRFEQVSDYRPITLRNKKFKVMDVDGNIGEPKLGIAGMR